MANSRVPKFGDWGSAAEAGYTVCFDQARKGRGAALAPTMATPINESEKPGKRSSPSREGRGAHRIQTKAEVGSGGAEVRRFSNFPPVNPNIVGGGADRRRHSAGAGVEGQRTGANQKGHGVGGRTNEKYSGRPARRPGTGGAAVPKFGDWDMNARAGAGDGGYTVIFNQARAEKNKGQSIAANLAPAAVHPNSLRNKSPVPAGNRHRGCCLPW